MSALLSIFLRVVVSLALAVNVAEQDMASGGVRLELLEARERFKRQLFVCLDGPVECFRMRMRGQRLKCAASIGGQRVVAREEGTCGQHLEGCHIAAAHK